MKSRLPTLLLLALLGLGAAAHAGASLISLQRFRQTASARNTEIAFPPGDLTLRDLPKAQQLMAAQSLAEIFDDGQYAGETNWYPFINPLLTAITAKITHQSATVSLALVAIAINAAVILAVGGLLVWLFGWKGLVALGAGLALNFITFNGGAYPIGTARLPFALFLIVAGALFAGPGRVSGRRRVALFAALGFLHGLMALWQGSSFITASFVGGVLILYWLAASRGGRGSALAGIGVYALVTLALFALLIGPQLLHYGRYVSGDEARLYLSNTYDKGDNLAPILSLRFLITDTGASLLALIGFAALFIRNPHASIRAVAAAILLAYVFATCMSALGYAQNSTQAPWLAQLIQKFMPAPAHTFGYVAQFCNALMRVMGVAAFVVWVMELAAQTPLRRLPPPALGAARAALAALAIIPIGLNFARQEKMLAGSGVDKEVTQFAAQAAALVPRNATVYGAESLMSYAPFKILLGSAPHANPYAQAARQQAKDTLTDQDLIGAGDAAPFTKTLAAAGLRYAIVSSNDKTAFLRLCAGERLLKSSAGAFELITLNDACAYPAFGSPISLSEAASAQNATLAAANGVLQMSAASGAGGFAIANFSAVPIQPVDLVGLRVRGLAEAPTCLTAGVLFQSKAQNKELGRASKTQTVSGAFEFTAWMVAPAGADGVVPALALDPACAAQPLRVESISIARKSLP